MAMSLDGCCQCGAVQFSVESHTPVPYQRCYCSICRASAGAGGFAINIGAVAETLTVTDWEALGMYHARRDDGTTSEAERYFCATCGSPLWLYDERWPELVHPVASSITTPLPAPPMLTHIMLGSKPDWVRADVGEADKTFDAYPDQSLADWHREQGLWVA